MLRFCGSYAFKLKPLSDGLAVKLYDGDMNRRWVYAPRKVSDLVQKIDGLLLNLWRDFDRNRSFHFFLHFGALRLGDFFSAFNLSSAISEIHRFPYSANSKHSQVSETFLFTFKLRYFGCKFIPIHHASVP